MLHTCAVGKGNLLLNIGPRGDGSIPEQSGSCQGQGRSPHAAPAASRLSESQACASHLLQYRDYREFLSLLREKSVEGVRFVFIAPSPGFYPDQEQSARRRSLAGRWAARFGEEKHLLNFIKVLVQMAAEENIDVIDAYNAMLQCENRRELFISNDGIHMTLKGHFMVSGLVADYLQKLGIES